MDRREALQTVALLTGGTIIGAQAILTNCTTPTPEYIGLLSENGQEAFMAEVAEIILPRTKSAPGAKDLNIASFMNVIVTEAYEPENQEIFITGISELNNRCIQQNSKGFIEATTLQRFDLLLELETEMKELELTKLPDDPPHYYQLMKQLTLIGYMTSKPVVTEVMRHTPVPGRFDPCIDYKEGEKAFS